MKTKLLNFIKHFLVALVVTATILLLHLAAIFLTSFSHGDTAITTLIFSITLSAVYAVLKTFYSHYAIRINKRK